MVEVAGGDDGMNHLMVRPEIQSYDDIRGKTVVVDAVDTAFALQLYKMLSLKGLKPGDYTVVSKGGTPLRLAAMRDDKTYIAGMLNLPWTILGERAGLRSLGSAVKAIGPYQGTGIWMLRSWAAANGETLVKYLQATVEGLRWARDPANRTAAAAILARTFKLEPDVAQLALERAFGPEGVIAEDARIDLAGFRNTLALRAELEGGTAAAPEKYLDLSYYDRALKGL
jgi:ABC-type nitrate/sulfonate/bicarbonate transport system substrate-binding protein